MPKLKTHKASAKRVKITKSGKIKRHKAGKGHLMASKNSKRRRRLKRGTCLEGKEEKRFQRLLNLR